MGKPPEQSQPTQSPQPCNHEQAPIPQPLNQNQSASHTEINVVNNQNNGQTPRARKGSNHKNTHD